VREEGNEKATGYHHRRGGVHMPLLKASKVLLKGLIMSVSRPSGNPKAVSRSSKRCD
jgi:hypothetical protein